MYSNNFDLEEISLSLDKVLGYLEYPGVAKNDYVIVAKKISEIIDVLVGYMESNYSKVSGLRNHNRMYWTIYMQELGRALYGMGLCAYKTNKFDDAQDWVGFAVTANTDERFVKYCDDLNAAAAREQGFLVTQTLAQTLAGFSWDINQRAEELISGLA